MSIRLESFDSSNNQILTQIKDSPLASQRIEVVPSLVQAAYSHLKTPILTTLTAGVECGPVSPACKFEIQAKDIYQNDRFFSSDRLMLEWQGPSGLEAL